MAEEKKEVATPKSRADGVKKKSAGTAVYPVSALIAESEKLFGVKKECTVAALKPLKADVLDVGTAKAAVEKFMQKKVR